METAKHIIIVLLILVLLTTGTALSEESQVSNTRTASCLIKVTSDPAILPLEDITINYLLHSSGIGGKAAREILEIQLSEEAMEETVKTEWLADNTDDIPPEPFGGEREEYEHEMMMLGMGRTEGPFPPAQPEPPRNPRLGRRITGESLSTTSEQTILLRLAINLHEDDIGEAVKPAAEEFMNALIKNLDVALKGAYEEHMQRLGSRLELAEEEAGRTERQLREMQNRLRNIAGSRILDRGSILNDIMIMRRDLQNIKMDQGSDQVIVNAITERIAETQAKLKEQVIKDDVTREMQQILERQMQQVATAKQLVERGMDDGRSLAEAEEKLSRARIELAQRREQMSRAAGGNLIESLNRELAERSVQAAQNRARMDSMSRQLAEAEEWLNKADDHELLSLKADIAKQNLREAIVWRDRISRQMRLIQPPAVSVLGGE